ncbi:hypothetical protein ACIBAG_44590 [Streptomyces sp. NPDC051243]|uniref:hypothetical protein n=1 Tax=Streptomyces sp. NPDC051243 TaxID=3365646 RepID=UPI0037969D58
MNSGEFLERSLSYALGSVADVEPGTLGCGTPCAEWDLGEPLGHLDDLLDALYEGLTGGRIGLVRAPTSPAASVRARAPCSAPGRPGRRSRPWWANGRWTYG